MNKRIFFQILFFFSLLQASAQNYLTNAQVYNFNVGDIFETEGLASGPPEYTLTIVLGKWYSISTDTIFYRDSITYYIPTGTFNTFIDTMRVTNLTLPAPQSAYINGGCQIIDTLYWDSIKYCNRRVWEEEPALSPCFDTLFEPVGENSWDIEGCGGPYGYSYDFTVPDYATYDLIYYKKSPDSCGGEAIITGINETVSKNLKMKLFPNPTNSILNIVTNADNYWYDIMDVTGKIVVSSSFPKSSQINLKGLANGNYVIDFYTKDYGRIAKQIEKQ